MNLRNPYLVLITPKGKSEPNEYLTHRLATKNKAQEYIRDVSPEGSKAEIYFLTAPWLLAVRRFTMREEVRLLISVSLVVVCSLVVLSLACIGVVPWWFCAISCGIGVFLPIFSGSDPEDLEPPPEFRFRQTNKGPYRS